jgi:hypothetical protein
MSTVKISQLPVLTAFAGANTGNATFVGVDVSQDKTVQFTGTTLAQQLYLNNTLIVGNNTIQLPNTVAQFSGNIASYMQINMQNFSNVGSADVILTADDGTDASGYLDLGLNNSQFNANAAGQTSQLPHDGYLIVDGPGANATGNLILGTANPGTKVVFAVGGYQSNNIVAVVAANGIVMNTNTYITFADGTKISTTNVITSAFLEANAAWTLANAAFTEANTTYSSLVSVATFVNAMANNANSSLVTTINFANAMANTTNLAYTEANNAASFANAAFTEANTTYSSLVSVTTFVNAMANTANSAYTEANSASAWANAINATQNTNITAAYNQANLANSIANTAVQNTATIVLNNLTLAGNLIPATSNLYSLGSPTLKWGNIYLGPNTIYMTDTVTGNIGNLVLQNGILTINGVTALGAGNTTIYANGTIVSPNVIITGSETANTVIANTFIYSPLTTTTAIQTGSRTTLVYANGTSGVIVGYNASAFTHGTAYVFTVNNNSVLHVSDIVVTTIQSTNCPSLQVGTANTRVGSFDVLVQNNSGPGNDGAYTMNLNFGIIRVGS